MMFAWHLRDAIYAGHSDFDGLTRGARSLLAVLALSSDIGTGGNIRRSNAALARFLGVNERHVRRWLAELRDRGLLCTDAPARGHNPPVRRLLNPDERPGANTSGRTSSPPLGGTSPPAQGGPICPPRGGDDVRPGGTYSPPKVDLQEDHEVNQIDVVVDGGGWPASPATDTTPRGPNAPPSRRQTEYIASLADELEMPASPVVRTRGEASRAISELKTETIKRRALRESTAREAGRFQGLVDGKHQQAAEAGEKLVDFIRRDERDRSRRNPVR